MTDALKVAEQRLEDYKKAISKKENEIVELKERIEDLDNFLEFGQALVSSGDDKPKTVSRTITPAAATKDTAIEPKASDDKDDDWGDDEDDNAASPTTPTVGIARVLSKRTG